MKNSKTTIVFTGGHAATTAIATIKKLKELEDSKFDIHWIGAKYAMEGKKILTFASRYIPALGVKFHSVKVGRIQKRFTMHGLLSLFMTPLGFVQCFVLLLMLKPKIVVSFGGYSSLPVIISAKLLGKKTILHEQTAVAGRANIVSGKFVDVVALSKKASKKYFPHDKCLLVGNPIMDNILRLKKKRKISEPPKLLIAGGSTGATFINKIIYSCIEDMLQFVSVVQITGSIDYIKFKRKASKLSQKLKKRYTVLKRVSPHSIEKIYRDVDVYVGRSGANTVSELMYLGIPSIFIPLPIAYLDEQHKNAEIAKNAGLAIIIRQDDLNCKLLMKNIRALIKKWHRIKAKKSSIENIDKKAADNLVRLILEMAK